jgi:hypothetical protein
MNGKSITSRTSSSSSSSVSVGTIIFPILLGSALLFYMMGFILSIRNLPDVNGNDVFFTAAGHVALRNAIMPLVQKVRREKVTTTATSHGDSDSSIEDTKYATLKRGVQARVKSALDRYKAGHQQAPLRKHVTNTPAVPVPEAKWPVTIRDEVDNFETIIHPGDGVTEMSVPKFWSDPLMTSTGPLMSRETALKVGSYATESRDVDSRTIFVAVASYRDFQCKETLDSIFARAKFPNRIRVGASNSVIRSLLCFVGFTPSLFWSHYFSNFVPRPLTFLFSTRSIFEQLSMIKFRMVLISHATPHYGHVKTIQSKQPVNTEAKLIIMRWKLNLQW